MHNFSNLRIYFIGGDSMYLILGMLITIVTVKYAFCLYRGFKSYINT